MHRALTVLSLLAVLAAPLGASAQKKPAILVLKLEAEGWPTDLTNALDDGIRAGVRRAKKGRLLPTPALDFGGMQLAAGCLDDSPDCLVAIGRPLNATGVMRAVLVGNAQHATLTVTIVGLSRRPQVYQAKLDDLYAGSQEELAWHAMTALGAKPAPLGGAIDLSMASNVGSLEGAEYFLDDKKVPKSALENVVPGSHRLEVHQRGFETFIWMGEVKKGRTEQVHVEMKPKGALAYDPPPSPPPDGTPPESPTIEPPAIDPPPPSDPISVSTTRESPIIYTFVVGGAAVVAAGIGVGFLVYGIKARDGLKGRTGDPNYEACTMNRGMPECAPFQPNLDRLHTATLGNISAFVTAGVLAAGAIGVFFLERSAQSDEPSVALGVAPTDGGAAASMSMRF